MTGRFTLVSLMASTEACAGIFSGGGGGTGVDPGILEGGLQGP